MGDNRLVTLQELFIVVKVGDEVGVSSEGEELLVGRDLLDIAFVQFDTVLLRESDGYSARGARAPVIEDGFRHIRRLSLSLTHGSKCSLLEKVEGSVTFRLVSPTLEMRRGIIVILRFEMRSPTISSISKHSLCPPGELIPGVCVVPEIHGPESYLETMNSVIIEDDRNGTCVIVDPGTDDGFHLDELIEECSKRGLEIVAGFVTHRHVDHAGCKDSFETRTGARVYGRAFGNLEHGTFGVSGFSLPLEIIPSPGHSSDSISIYVPDRSLLLIGDLVFEDSSSQICFPDGSLSDYLATLDTLVDFVSIEKPDYVLPGHRGVLSNPLERFESVKRHRIARYRETLASIETTGISDPYRLTLEMYSNLSPFLLALAFATMLANFAYGIERGEIDPIDGLPSSYQEALDSFEAYLHELGDDRAIHLETP